MARLKASKYRKRYKDVFSRIAEAEYWVASLASGGRVPTEDARLNVLKTIADYAEAKAGRAAKINAPLSRSVIVHDQRINRPRQRSFGSDLRKIWLGGQRHRIGHQELLGARQTGKRDRLLAAAPKVKAQPAIRAIGSRSC
jgi:hypothetical protein